MGIDATEAPCPRCGKPRAEWTENGGAGVSRGEVTYCSQECADQDARPASLEQGGSRIGGGPAAGPAAGPDVSGSPAAAPSPPDFRDPRAGGPRPDPQG